MTFQWWFNGQDMSKYLETNNVERNIGQNRKAILQKLGVSSGKRFQYTSADEGKVTVSFLVRRDMVAKRREIAGLLSSNEPQQLIFGDEPDKYYLAIADGQISLSEKFRHGNGEVTFIVPDGMAHSNELTMVTGQSGTDIALTNDGTAPTAPVLTATMHGDNGLVSFVNDQGGVLQFGSPDEIDGTTKQRSERVRDDGMDTAPSGGTANAFATNYPAYVGTTNANIQVGTFGFGTQNAAKDAPGSYECQPKWSTATSGVWSGPAMSWPVPKSSAGNNTGNFLFKLRFSFATSVTQVGRLEINLTNGSKVAYGAIIRDSQATADGITVEFWVGSSKIYQVSLDRKKFTNGMYRELMIGRIGNTLTMQIAAQTGAKAGNISTVRSAVTKTWTLDSTTNVAIDGYGFWFQQFAGLNVVQMSVSDAQFSWVNVGYWQDLPNRWSDGDVLTADVANKAIYVNGVSDPTLHTVGNTWDKFMLQPGENTIQTIGSSWCTTPLDVSVQYREAYY